MNPASFSTGWMRLTIIGLRDRALIGLMVYTFARIGAATGMDIGTYRVWFRLAPLPRGHDPYGRPDDRRRRIGSLELR